jgi:type VI secretion system protein ImpG
VVYFDIRAEMWAQPLPMELYLRSEVDVTTGELKLERVAEPLMDTRLLKHYEGELAFLRDMGAEFAASLSQDRRPPGHGGARRSRPLCRAPAGGCRLPVGAGAAGTGAAVSAFTANLLEIVYPHYLCPTPSMMVARFEPDSASAAMKDGILLPRGTPVAQFAGRGANRPPASSQTARDVTLWPLEIAEAEYIDGRGRTGRRGLRAIPRRGPRSGCGCAAHRRADRGTVARRWCCSERQGGRSWELHELLATQVTGLAGRSTDRRADWVMQLPRAASSRAASPPRRRCCPARRSFDGYRLLQEYFAMPERFHFVELTGLGPAIGAPRGRTVDIYILLREGPRRSPPGRAADAFTLNAVPGVNLFRKRCDRVPVSAARCRTPRRRRPHRAQGFRGLQRESRSSASAAREPDVPFRPFYSPDLTSPRARSPGLLHPVPQDAPAQRKERLRGVRTSYLGSETLPVAGRRPAGALSASSTSWRSALVTNRDLPLLLGTGGRGCVPPARRRPGRPCAHAGAPTRPRPDLAQGDTAWRLISHLSLNYLSIADTENGGGAPRCAN